MLPPLIRLVLLKLADQSGRYVRRTDICAANVAVAQIRAEDGGGVEADGGEAFVMRPRGDMAHGEQSSGIQCGPDSDHQWWSMTCPVDQRVAVTRSDPDTHRGTGPIDRGAHDERNGGLMELGRVLRFDRRRDEHEGDQQVAHTSTIGVGEAKGQAKGFAKGLR